MASSTDIANLALGHLGEAATVTSIDPPEGSVHAHHAARFYPIARDELLERRAWNFAVKRRSLALLDVDVPGWEYVYAAPSDMIRPLSVYDSTNGEDIENPVAFDTETTVGGTIVILTNQEDAELRYIFRASEPERFSPLFTSALSWLLASYLAGPVVKGEAGVGAGRSAYQVYMSLMGEAAASNANASQQSNERQAPWVEAR